MEPISLLVAAVLLVAGLAPWWVVGRYCIPARERVALRDMDPQTVVTTLRRGADAFVPDRYRDGHPPRV